LKVLFVYPDFPANADSSPRHGYYSEGLASLSAVLKESGHQVSLCHLTRPASVEEFGTIINDAQPGLIAFSVRTTVFPFVQDYVKWAKNVSDALVVCGGYHPTIAPEEAINVDGVDIVAIGE
jgi:anaerobic magnesium-protoporphyrin IX monomethyl ester cyclase